MEMGAIENQACESFLRSCKGGKMWGKYNIYLRADQCCDRNKQKRIKHRLEECFQPPLRRGCHSLADGVSLSQGFCLLQHPRVLSAGSPSTSSTGASAWVHLLEPLLRELIQVGIGQKREDGIHLADVIPLFAHSQVTGELGTEEGYGHKRRDCDCGSI